MKNNYLRYYFKTKSPRINHYMLIYLSLKINDIQDSKFDHSERCFGNRSCCEEKLA